MIVTDGEPDDMRAVMKALEDDLVRTGARFDLVDTVTLEQVEDVGLTEILLRAIDRQ